MPFSGCTGSRRNFNSFRKTITRSWWATFHWVATRWTRLSTHTHTSPGPRVPGINMIQRTWSLLPKNPRSNWAVPSNEDVLKSVNGHVKMDTERCELGTGLRRFVSSLHRDTHLIFSSCNTYQSQHAYPISKHHKTTLQIIWNFFFKVGWQLT